MTYAFIQAERGLYPVQRQCRVLGVSRAGYYAWRGRSPSARTEANATLLVHIRAIHAHSRETYGSPRVHAELQAQEIGGSENRVARLMRLNHVRARHKRRYRPLTTRVDRSLPVAPNRLTRPFHAARTDQTWLSDITYIPTAQGWLYLAVVLDLCSRRVVGWSMREDLSTRLPLDALAMALGRRRPPAALIHHSDRGSQYASGEYGNLLAAHRLVASMSRAGNCYDNAPMESFFSTLKAECTDRQQYLTRAEAREDIVAYVEGFYNVSRRHSSLGYRSPAEFENLLTMA